MDLSSCIVCESSFCPPRKDARVCSGKCKKEWKAKLNRQSYLKRKQASSSSSSATPSADLPPQGANDQAGIGAITASAGDCVQSSSSSTADEETKEQQHSVEASQTVRETHSIAKKRKLELIQEVRRVNEITEADGTRVISTNIARQSETLTEIKQRETIRQLTETFKVIEQRIMTRRTESVRKMFLGPRERGFMTQIAHIRNKFIGDKSFDKPQEPTEKLSANNLRRLQEARVSPTGRTFELEMDAEQQSLRRQFSEDLRAHTRALRDAAYTLVDRTGWFDEACTDLMESMRNGNTLEFEGQKGNLAAEEMLKLKAFADQPTLRSISRGYVRCLNSKRKAPSISLWFMETRRKRVSWRRVLSLSR
jgi:hypothetical protein